MNVTIPAITNSHLIVGLLLIGAGWLLRHWGIGAPGGTVQKVEKAIASALPTGVVQLGKHTISLDGNGNLSIATPQPTPPPKISTIPLPT